MQQQSNSQNPLPRDKRFTGPRRERFSSLTEARRDAELPAGEFEEEHDGQDRPERRDH
ncbi:MAG: hypothetical protein P0Y65_16675 [Candidatus Devosia phytovorans]|uniref:Uncharacterized protein n=1 Tax=Candidatus Devosia phytovorans TaxID=3121372 RepID=A0AAJ5VT28_9HYPH|nr:hypothetical protein [Devosia sp.]WEK03807.1 MAG: hypothetical protein P0Y65_16675 [Devosia sp.]